MLQRPVLPLCFAQALCRFLIDNAHQRGLHSALAAAAYLNAPRAVRHIAGAFHGKIRSCVLHPLASLVQVCTHSVKRIPAAAYY